MKQLGKWAWPVVFGSLWGFLEVIGGEAFFKRSIPLPSAWLTAWGLLMLATSRGIIPKAGSSTLAGATAALFKLVNAPPFYCHLLAIVCVGLLFDAAASLIAADKLDRRRGAVIGMVGAYGGHIAFAVLITYVFRYEFWVAEGLPRILRYVVLNGSLAAVLAAVLVPLGFRLGQKAEPAMKRKPRWATAGALAAVAVSWMLGRFVG